MMMKDDKVILAKYFSTICENGDIPSLITLLSSCQSLSALDFLLFHHHHQQQSSSSSLTSSSSPLHLAAKQDQPDVFLVIICHLLALSQNKVDRIETILNTRDASGQSVMALAQKRRSGQVLSLLTALTTYYDLKPPADYQPAHSIVSSWPVNYYTTYLPWLSFLFSLLAACYFTFHFYAHRDRVEDSSLPYLLCLLYQLAVWVSVILIHWQGPGKLRSRPSDLTSYMNILHDVNTYLTIGQLSTSRYYCCHLCRCRRPLRAGHSLRARCCLPCYDHFCTFLFADIGRDNHNAFLSFLTIMACLAMPLYLRLAANYLRREVGEGDWPARAFAAWTFLIWLFILSQLLYHVYLSYYGWTLREMRGGVRRFAYLSHPHLVKRAMDEEVLWSIQCHRDDDEDDANRRR